MLSPSDTAYPLLRESPTGRELQELFTPNLSELGFAGENTRQHIPRLGLLLLLKSFQKLGYFLRLAEISSPIVLQGCEGSRLEPDTGRLIRLRCQYGALSPHGSRSLLSGCNSVLRRGSEADAAVLFGKLPRPGGSG